MTGYRRSSEAVSHIVEAMTAALPSLRHCTQKVLKVVGPWMDRSRQRRALASLDDRLLKDIGITRSQAEREIGKSFWR